MNFTSTLARSSLAITLFIGSVNIAVADLYYDVLDVQHQWAKANYDTAKEDQEKAFEDLLINARKVVDQHPDKAEPLVWLAISLSTDAGVNGGFSALGKVKEARTHLEAAEKIDPIALNGSIYTSLGSLYYQVPGWPIGFGDDDKAETYLKKALSINPIGIDPNFFYGDFMLEEGNYQAAVDYLTKASNAPDRLNRALADKGRRVQIAEKLKIARGSL